jgi:hypothetical protein
VSKRLTFLLLTEAHSCASSGNANGLTRLASFECLSCESLFPIACLSCPRSDQVRETKLAPNCSAPLYPKTLRGGHRAPPTI